MAYISDATKLDRLWKISFNKVRGDSTAQFFEELIPTVVDIHASEIPYESITTTPPLATNSIVNNYYPGDLGRISLTLDKKYNGNRVWVAKPTFDSNFSSGSGTITDILRNFISPKYGSGYVVKVYDGSGTQIPELFGDSSGSTNTGSWLFDYKSGVLVFESNRSETGANTTNCIKIDAYQYAGRFLTSKADIVQGGVTGDLAVLDSQGNIADSGYTVNQIKDKNYVHDQMVASSTWTVTHNLSKFPSIQVVDSGGTVVIGEVVYVSTNQVQLTFTTSFAGAAYFN